MCTSTSGARFCTLLSRPPSPRGHTARPGEKLAAEAARDALRERITDQVLELEDVGTDVSATAWGGPV